MEETAADAEADAMAAAAAAASAAGDPYGSGDGVAAMKIGDSTVSSAALAFLCRDCSSGLASPGSRSVGVRSTDLRLVEEWGDAAAAAPTGEMRALISLSCMRGRIGGEGEDTRAEEEAGG